MRVGCVMVRRERHEEELRPEGDVQEGGFEPLDFISLSNQLVLCSGWLMTTPLILPHRSNAWGG